MLFPWAARIFLAAVLFLAYPLYAEQLVAPGEESLRLAISNAPEGETLRLEEGRYGAAVIDKPLTLLGVPGSVVDAGGKGSALTVKAPNVLIRGVTVSGSGIVENDLDSGILALKAAANVRIEENQIVGNLYGVSIQGAARAIVRGNRITNRTDLWINDQGNGINIWDTTGSYFENNHVEGGRDGLYIHTAHGNFIRGNRFIRVRFAVHYMYANDNEISDNISIDNSVGYALMYSDNLKILRNISLRDRDHGLMFHSSRKSELAYNLVRQTHDKCTFVYTSSHNSIHHNRFEGCEIGIHFTGGSEKNAIHENDFINNRTQVKYSGMVHYEWSKNGRGNYWSDNPAFDLNGDGIADVAYRPNTLMDQVLWRYPLAKLLLSSPVMESLRVAQNHFPALAPGGVVDSWPLMHPSSIPVAVPADLADGS
ncbi:nitrous oxide reductase family maturation protein NosD [Candidatus Magnetaquicoccus inordinatus]|uniref:nitrous oxide reductase family maturation protein NosD n=1 Tax=Candidatus Magnetaquicoccus inordinatus TaxID=2496818 RepID=UPI001D0DED42|nr:nitrous oxide reductase family maturation protein NosD [Candidatus Magnetaquicoccus inordinatus]